MFRHVVMVRLTQEMTGEQKEALRAGLGRLPEVIPDIRAYRFGDDVGLNEGNFDFVVTADFDDAD
ncbi:MAG TPA: Dabb family protein, partial [Acidimicrobiia bacterium]|nr:Dabb family protein [Acidimicrobiia bacterium]